MKVNNPFPQMRKENANYLPACEGNHRRAQNGNYLSKNENKKDFNDF
jgi:hypothetical protein